MTIYLRWALENRLLFLIIPTTCLDFRCSDHGVIRVKNLCHRLTKVHFFLMAYLFTTQEVEENKRLLPTTRLGRFATIPEIELLLEKARTKQNLQLDPAHFSM